MYQVEISQWPVLDSVAHRILDSCPLPLHTEICLNQIDDQIADQIDAHRRSYMELTTQVRPLTVKLANRHESLAVHSDRSQVGFLINFAYFMAAEKRPRWVWRVVTMLPCGLLQCGPKLSLCRLTVRVCSWTPAVG